MFKAIKKLSNQILYTPSEILEIEFQEKLAKKLAELDITNHLELLQDAMALVVDQGGSNPLNIMLDSLNDLLKLKVTGDHTIYLCNTPVKVSFNRAGGLTGLKVVQGELPKRDSVHLKPALK
jgi:hypothetical protein